MHDITLYSVEELLPLAVSDELAVIMNTGLTDFMPSRILKSSCIVDTRYFPHDMQTCTFKFASWAYDGFALDIDFLDNDEVDVYALVVSSPN